jgi:hypothetical protein
MTVNLDSSPSLDRVVKPLDQAVLHGRGIRIAEAVVDLREASLYRTPPSFPRQLGLNFDKMGKTLRIASFLLAIVDTSQSVLDPHGLAYERVVDFVSNGVMPLKRSNGERQFREAALNIIGLGSGFTPSGDDTLGGFLAAYNSLANVVGRRPVLFGFSLLQERTSWISAKLLDYMQRLIVDEQLYRLVDCAAGAEEDAVVLGFETLLPRGHTSGIDISVGAILALGLIRDIAFEKEGATVITSALGLSS